MQESVPASIDRQIDEVHARIRKAISAGRNVAGEITGQESANLTRLQVERLAAGKALAELKVQTRRIEGERTTSPNRSTKPAACAAGVLGLGLLKSWNSESPLGGSASGLCLWGRPRQHPRSGR